MASPIRRDHPDQPPLCTDGETEAGMGRTQPRPHSKSGQSMDQALPTFSTYSSSFVIFLPTLPLPSSSSFLQLRAPAGERGLEGWEGPRSQFQEDVAGLNSLS